MNHFVLHVDPHTMYVYVFLCKIAFKCKAWAFSMMAYFSVSM